VRAELPIAPPVSADPDAPTGAPPLILTAEQRRAIAVRDGDLLLDASAGSGKTSVLVERFARAVVHDGAAVDAILAITFTEKAAAELRDRIRARLRSLGARDEARATEGAFVSTIHGFCTRVLRAHALTVGIDPEFAILDEPEARGLALAAFEDALCELACAPDGTELVASYRPDQLRGAILGTYAELRSRGEREPRLPAFPASRDDRYAQRVYELLDRLLRRFGSLYNECKYECSGLDFSDLELLVRDLFAFRPELRDRYAERFARVMVDELQDVNAVQLELIQAIARENLFAVGDAQQSIYGFRHADVELFERLGERLERGGRRMTLETNFRSRPQILDVVNRAFSAELGDRFRELRAGRDERSARSPAGHTQADDGADLVELLIVDKGFSWPAGEGLFTPWRVAEARALAARIGELLDAGASARDVVVLTRATTDLRCYERALEDHGIPTYVIGGRGYWSHPQVIDLLAYLRALANPLDEEALYTVLVSPLVGVSLDALVLVAAAGRDAGRDGSAELEGIGPSDAARIGIFAGWFAQERELAARASVEEVIERVLASTGYDLYMLGLSGGERRLANVRKLMRLAREHAALRGPDLRGFLEFVRERAASSGGSEESEAPVEGEALDAVRLMTIHRAKGLEFEIVCVADLGRETPRGRSADILRVGADGRVGLRLAWPGTGRSVPVLDHEALCEECQAAEAAEERRLLYVAMTRARERLILSGAAKLEPDGQTLANDRGAPIGWITRALRHAGITPAAIRSETDGAIPTARDGDTRSWPPEPPVAPEDGRSLPATEPSADEPLPALSYSSLTEYRRCGYRFYLQRVLGLPDAAAPVGPPQAGATAASAEALTTGPSGAAVTDPSGNAATDLSGTAVTDLSGTAVTDPSGAAPTGPSARVASEPSEISAIERGILAHELLANLDFEHPVRPTRQDVAAAAQRAGLVAPGDEDVSDLVYAFAGSPLAQRLASAAWIRREERFSFLLSEEPMITGVLDVIAGEAGGRMLVVDYKSDRLEGQAPEAVVASAYATQRLVYALAALRAGALEVEIAHVFLERPEHPAVALFRHAELARLERELEDLVSGIRRRDFSVADEPGRSLCRGCPAEGGLCPWPLELTRR
jgi:ATP-dependent exoDNAse (exonuclease V) beta subunit